MKICPYCGKEENSDKEYCSCGYYLLDDIEEENNETQKSNKEIKELIEDEERYQRNNLKRIIYYTLIPLFIFVIYKVSSIKTTSKDEKIKYQVIDSYEELDDYDFDKIMESNINEENKYLTRKNKENTKDIVRKQNGRLFTSKYNIDEQIIVFEYPIPIINNQNELEAYIKLLKQEYIENSSINITLYEIKTIELNNKINITYIPLLIDYPDGDRRYSFYNFIEVKNKYYQIIINTYDLNNTIDKLMTIN